MLALYSLLLVFLGLLAFPYFLIRDLTTGKYSGELAERFGRLPPGIAAASGGSVWIHAVSVGEVQAAKTLLSGLRSTFPDHKLFLSVTTRTGRRLAETQITDVDGIFQCPFDLGFIVRRVVRRINPKFLLIIETELWPHLIEQCRANGARCVLLNGRISDRSYPRYRKIRFFVSRMLKRLDAICVQSELYRERFITLGASPERVTMTGSLKFDIGSDPPPVPEIGRQLGHDRRIILAGSTLAPEESLLLDAFGQLASEHETLRLVIAPRHPERFDEVVDLVRSRALSVARRSALASSGEQVRDEDVIVLDTIGELAGLYAIAEIVFVGGSLGSWGGHNIIEPAIFSKPILFGPHMENFREIAASFVDRGAGIQLTGSDELARQIGGLLRQPARAEQMGTRARELVAEHHGAAQRSLAVVSRLSPGS